MLEKNFKELISVGSKKNSVVDDHIERLFNKILLPNILNFDTSLDNFLEIGCGDGRYAKNIVKYVNKYIGIDIREESLRFARSLLKNNKKAVFIKNSGSDLREIKNSSIDFVF